MTSPAEVNVTGMTCRDIMKASLLFFILIVRYSLWMILKLSCEDSYNGIYSKWHYPIFRFKVKVSDQSRYFLYFRLETSSNFAAFGKNAYSKVKLRVLNLLHVQNSIFLIVIHLVKLIVLSPNILLQDGKVCQRWVEFY